MNCGGRFGFGGCTVLVGSSGDPVSFYTTVHGGGCLALLDRVWGLEGCLRLRWDLITLVFDDVIYQWHHIK